MKPVGFVFVGCGVVVWGWWGAVGDLLDWRMVEAGKGAVDVDKKYLEEVVGLEEYFVNLFVFVDDALFFFWEVELPIDEHGICIGYSRF